MIELTLGFIFLFWLLLTLTYGINRKLLGNLGKWLHRYGWLNEWSMYTHFSDLKAGANIYVQEMEHEQDQSEWKPIKNSEKRVFRFVFNPSLRIQYFYNRCYKKLVHELSHSSGTRLESSPFFDYMCAVIQELPNPNKTKFRRVKIERILPNGEVHTLIESDLIQVK